MMQLKLQFVKCVKRRGKSYYYFNTGQKTDSGSPIHIALPDPTAPDFFNRYAGLKAGRTKRANAAAVLTVDRLIDLFERSPKFGELSAESQRIYLLTFKKIRLLFGQAPANDLTASDITYYMDANAHTPGAANTLLSTVGAVYQWGRKRRHTVAEPTKDVEKLKTGEHMPWPDHVLEAALRSTDRRVRLAVNLLYYTGQRIGDVTKMRWSDIRGGKIYLTQQKTGKYLVIPIHRELAKELAKQPIEGITMFTAPNGKPMGPQRIRIALKKAAPGFVPHGLRKNAVIALLAQGCTIAEVASITGQTFQMVEYYAKQLDQEKFADAAILKWENKK